jgi:hypothetical protein
LIPLEATQKAEEPDSRPSKQTPGRDRLPATRGQGQETAGMVLAGAREGSLALAFVQGTLWRG